MKIVSAIRKTASSCIATILAVSLLIPVAYGQDPQQAPPPPDQQGPPPQGQYDNTPPPSFAPQQLDGIHHIGALRENGVAEIVGPVDVAGHHVENGREGKQRENAGIPGKLIGIDGVGKLLAAQIVMLVRPARSVGDIVAECGGGQNLREQRVGIKSDARNHAVELLGRKGSRRSLVVLALWRRALLIGRRWRLLRVLRVGDRD